MPSALILCEYPTLNGGERSLLAVLPHLQNAGWDFASFAPTNGPLAHQFYLHGVKTSFFDIFRLGDRYEYYASRLKQSLRLGTYDLVHANSLAMGTFCGPIAKSLGVPCISHIRDIVRLNAKKIAQLNCHTRLIAVSEAVRTHHVAQGLDAEKTHVLHNGIDLSVFLSSPASPSGFAGEGPGVRGTNEAIRAEIQIPPTSKLIALIGQIILRKAQDTALRAIVPLLQADPEMHALLLGERHSQKQETIDYERNLHTITAEAGIADRVHWLGTRDDVAQLLPQCNLLLHTARQEPLGRVLLEAAACGVPIVATDVGGTREIFPREADDGALLIPIDDVIAAMEACRRVLYDAHFALDVGHAGRRRIEAAFSVETAAAGLLRHYQEVSGVG